MGLSSSILLTQKDLDNYQELTYFNKQEILQAYRVFKNLDKDSVKGRRHNLEVPVQKIMNIPELKIKVVKKLLHTNPSTFDHFAGHPQGLCLFVVVNPFRDRLCAVFTNNRPTMTFEEFLDMMSVLSSNAPKDLKAYYAFNVYDFNNDLRICEKDLLELLDRLTYGIPQDSSSYTEGKLLDKEKKKIIKEVLAVADLDRDQELSFSEFCHIIDKSPDFITSFVIHL